MDRTYLPVLLLLGFVAVNAVMILAISHYLTRHRPTPVKQEPYESGMPVLSDARERFSVKFYMVAMLFIIFDVETVLLVPWAVHYQQLSCAVPLVDGGVCAPEHVSFYGFGAMLIFMVVLVAGFVYEWKKGAMQWD